MNRFNISDTVNPEKAGMRRASCTPGTPAEAVVAVTAKPRFMAAGAELLIGSRCNRVRHMEIAFMHIDHGIAEIALLVGKTGCVAVKAITLAMAGGAFHIVTFRLRAMVERPCHSVGFGGTKPACIDQGFVMAEKADLLVRHDALRIRHMADMAGEPRKIFFEMIAMIKVHTPSHRR